MEKILAFQMREEELLKVKRAAKNQGVRVEMVQPEMFRMTLGALADQKGEISAEPYLGEVPMQSMLIFCGLEEKKFDKLLVALKKNQVHTDYKVWMTPANRTWNILRIYAEMEREKRAYEAGNV